MKPTRTPRNSGFTLVEIMVAMALGLVLTAGATYLFISNKQTHRMANAVSELQEKGRFLLRTVGHDLRMAGHLGCADPTNINVASTAPGLNVPNLFAAPATVVSGELVIRYAAATGNELESDMADPTADIVFSDDTGLNPNDSALLTNCTRTDLFTVTNATLDGASGTDTVAHAANDSDGDTVNTSASLSEAYQVGTGSPPRVRAFRVFRYGIATVGNNNAGDVIGTLERNGQTLVRGMQAMVARFGECVGLDQIQYVEWANVTDPTRIVAVRIGFLLHSTDRVLESADTQTYQVAGASIDPPDDPRLRRVFSTTISLRNERVEEC